MPTSKPQSSSIHTPNPSRISGLRRSQQKGAAAIEFALVFMMLFSIFYGTVSYALPLLLMQSFNHASTDAVREVITYNPQTPNFNTVINTEARNIVGQRLNWVPSAFAFNPNTHVTTSYSSGVIRVEIRYPSSLIYNVVPRLVLPIVGAVPKLPTELSVASSFRLSRS